MTKFKEKFEKVHDKVKFLKIEGGFDNVMGLTYLDGIVDVITQTPQLREYLHGIIQKLIGEVMEYDYPNADEEFMKDYI